MPVLPLIDLMILVGWTSLVAGFLLKAIYITTHYRPLLIGLSPIDFLLIAVVCLLFSLSLAARTWVKAHEPGLLRGRQPRRRDALDPFTPEHPHYAAAAAGLAADGESLSHGQLDGRADGAGAATAAEAAESEPMGQRSGRSSAKAEVASSA